MLMVEILLIIILLNKRNTMHDDKVFVYGLLCWYLSGLRRGQIINQNNDDKLSDIIKEINQQSMLSQGKSLVSKIFR